jgi:hypothetical protein
MLKINDGIFCIFNVDKAIVSMQLLQLSASETKFFCIFISTRLTITFFRILTSVTFSYFCTFIFFEENYTAMLMINDGLFWSFTRQLLVC